jgi:type IV pilus assembly protein PilW
MKTIGDRSAGFTLVELLIAMVMSAFVIGATYSLFTAQQRAYNNQQAVADIQQNLRAGMYYLTREIHLAGYQRQGASSIAGIVKAGPGVLRFTMDIYNGIDDDGDSQIDEPDEIGINDDAISSAGEDILYSLTDDANGDGIPDTLTAAGTPQPAVLSRTDVLGANVAEPLMDNVEAVAFAYAFDNDTDGLVDRDPGNNIIWAVDTDNDGWLDTTLDTNNDGVIDINDAAGGQALASSARVNIDRIRMVRIWLLVRSSDSDPSFTDNETYVIGLQRLAVNDHYRRRLLTATVMCRNMGG